MPLFSRHAGRSVLLTLLLSRMLVLAVTAVMAAIQRNSPVALWTRLDSIWYQGIAQYGYHWTFDGKSALAFFPLFPLLLHLALALGISGTLAGIVISNLAFAGALLYLYALSAPRVGSMDATRVLMLLALFPTAFFSFAPYTEALFLLAATGAWYHAGARQWARSGMYLALAVLTRSTGFALVLPLACMVWQSRSAVPYSSNLRGVAKKAALVFGPAVIGWLLYLRYLQSHHIALAAVLHAQRGWHRALTWPWIGFTASLSWLSRHSTENAGWTAENVVQMTLAIVFLGLTARAWRDFDLPTRTYCLVFWVLVLASPEYLDDYLAPLSSIDRFVLALFPLAIWAGKRITGRWERPVIVAFALLLAGSTAVHIGGGWVG